MADTIEVKIVDNDGKLVDGVAGVDNNGEWVVEFEGGFVKFPKCTEAELAEHIEKHNAANLQEEE